METVDDRLLAFKKINDTVGSNAVIVSEAFVCLLREQFMPMYHVFYKKFGFLEEADFFSEVVLVVYSCIEAGKFDFSRAMLTSLCRYAAQQLIKKNKRSVGGLFYKDKDVWLELEKEQIKDRWRLFETRRFRSKATKDVVFKLRLIQFVKVR